ncbi:hypothetical protein [Tamlana crocina]|uniref:Uncharacterized protein n=1 Tax=Tamlana crocina TaxID=393006 RepID=A0ABX1DD22_9FLAO|nr:hypothetical protein [Tamlana crocina]NJX16245.1 hypothetical protein [Tamlana crocina]
MKDNKLHNIKSTGFKAPDNYFDTLEDRLFTEAKLKANVSGPGFVMPEDYLDGLENTILNKVPKAKEPKVISIFSKRTLVYVSSIAAAILLLFNLSILETKPASFDTLDMETVENFVLEEDVVDSDELASLITEEDLTESGFIDTNFDENQIETFLLEHLDVEDLLVD